MKRERKKERDVSASTPSSVIFLSFSLSSYLSSPPFFLRSLDWLVFFDLQIISFSGRVYPEQYLFLYFQTFFGMKSFRYELSLRGQNLKTKVCHSDEMHGCAWPFPCKCLYLFSESAKISFDQVLVSNGWSFFSWNSQCDRHHWTSDLSSRARVIEVSRNRSGCRSNRWHDRRRRHLGCCSSFDLFPRLPKTEKVSLPRSSRRTCKWQWRLRTMATTPGTDGEEKQIGSVYSEVSIISDTAATQKNQPSLSWDLTPSAHGRKMHPPR